MPASLLIQWATEIWRGVMLYHFFRDAKNSILPAGITALLGAFIGLLMAFGSRISKRCKIHWAARLVSLGYILRGPVVALGVLLPFAWFDQTMNSWIQETFGITISYLLSGTLFILVFAYLVWFLALVYGSA